jgi:DNA-directed RNA polymerase beta' subunit
MSAINNTIKDSYVELNKIDAVTLSVLSPSEVDAMSVTKIFEQLTYNANGDPVTHGINDDLMGTMDRDRHCKTCMGTQVDCPGHFGHIKLEKPVYHANLLDYIRKVLKAVCFNCSHLLADTEGTHKKELDGYIEIKNTKSRFNKVQRLCATISECKNCKSKNRSYSRANLKIEYKINDQSEMKPNNDTIQVLWPEDAKAILSKITPRHLHMLGLNKHLADPANMIIENLTVVPPPVRPSV